MPSSSSKTLKSVGHIWMVIFILSIVSFITVLLALFQNEVEFFGEAVWQNNDNIGLGRGYFIVLTTSVLTLLTSSYGHWRACVPAAWVATIDELATRLITANASLCLTSFILFSNILVCALLFWLLLRLFLWYNTHRQIMFYTFYSDRSFLKLD